jgi:type IV pilus assembly protein PilA
MRNRQKGFSLIELLIVVAIILIIAAIAIPNLLRSKMAANEASAVATLRTLTTASIAYSTTYGAYETDLTKLAPVPVGTAPTSDSADLVDNVLSLATPVKSGYTFTFASSGGTYTINADPTTPGVTGQRHFFTDPTGVIRVNGAAAATVSDSPIS